MGRKFFSLSSVLSLAGHPITPQGRDGGPDFIRSVAIVFDRNRKLFQAIFFGNGLDISKLAQDIAQAGYELHTVLPVQPEPGTVPPSAVASGHTRSTSSARKARTSADASSDQVSQAAARALRAAEAMDLIRQILGV